MGSGSWAVPRRYGGSSEGSETRRPGRKARRRSVPAHVVRGPKGRKARLCLEDNPRHEEAGREGAARGAQAQGPGSRHALAVANPDAKGVREGVEGGGTHGRGCP